MAQQINLLTPILLKPRRHFTALAMVQALALVLVGTLALGAWIHSRADLHRAEFRQRSESLKVQQDALARSLATLPGAGDVKTLDGQIALLKQQMASQSELLQSLTTGQRPAGQRHSDLLALLANTVPESVWLQSLRWQAGQLDLSGGTLDPAALRAWVAQLQTQALLQRITVSEVRLELVNATAANTGDSGIASRLQLPPGAAQGRPVWAFQVRGVAPSASAVAANNAGGQP